MLASLSFFFFFFIAEPIKRIVLHVVKYWVRSNPFTYGKELGEVGLDLYERIFKEPLMDTSRILNSKWWAEFIYVKKHIYMMVGQWEYFCELELNSFLQLLSQAFFSNMMCIGIQKSSKMFHSAIPDPFIIFMLSASKFWQL